MKPRNLIIWAGLTCACLIAFLSCAPITKLGQIMGLTQEKVKLTPEELQRLVYSSHVLTVIDDKPELEAALLALRELHRENPQANPASLVRPVSWALEEYRNEALSRTLTVTWRDEVLGRYFLKFSEDPEDNPEIPERRQVVLNLLNVLLAQQEPSDLLKQRKEPFNAGRQRLIGVANGPGERQALVESCIRQAQSNPNFAEAMDKLLEPEVEVALNAPPREILYENQALDESPTMKELVHLSSSSKNGSVEITMDKLKGLFAAEVAVAQEAVTTHQALDREVAQAREGLVRYPDDTTRLAAQIQRYAEEQVNQTRRVVATSAAATALSKMTLKEDTEFAKTQDTCGKIIGLIGNSLAQIGGISTNPAGAYGGAFSLMGAACQFVTLFEHKGPPPEKTILESVKLVGEMISDLSDQMEDRFDHVDLALAQTLRGLSNAVLLIGKAREDILKMSQNVVSMREDLSKVQASVHRLKDDLYTYFDTTFLANLVPAITGALGSKEMKYDQGYMSYREAENIFYGWAVVHATNLVLSNSREQDDLDDSVLLSELTERPLESNLNYIKEFLRRRLDLSQLSTDDVANPLYWYIGASAYLRLAAEHPEYFRRMVSSKEHLDDVIQIGTNLEDFFRTITFDKNGTVNRELYDAILDYYKDKLDAFSRMEASLVADVNVPLWRQWEARTARVAVADTAVIGEYCFQRFPTDVAGIAAGEHHSLAIRVNGSVVAWGDNSLGLCDVPSGLRDVIAISASEYHNLALKKDGTIVAWGENRYGQCDIPEHKAVKKVCVAPHHSLALQADGRVIAWGSNFTHACDVPDEAKTGIVDIAATGIRNYDMPDISVALKDDGTVVFWGGSVPVPRGRLSNVVAIAAGFERFVGVKDDGRVVGWPEDDTSVWYMVPFVRNDVTEMAAVALGGNFTLALKKDGTLEVIDGSIEGTPKTDGFVAIAAGGSHALALRDDGSVVAWGDAYVLGDGTQRPVRVADNGSCLMEDGHAASLWYKMGNLSDLGPATMLAVGDVTAGFGIGKYCLVLKPNGTMEARGSREFNKDDLDVLNGLSSVVDIAVSRKGGHCLALLRDGTVKAWGGYFPGQYNASSVLDILNAVAVTAGAKHCLVLRADGTVIARGDDSFAQCEVPGTLDDVVSIAAGDYHNLALRANGTVVA